MQKVIVVIGLLFSGFFLAQIKDSIKIEEINEVVVSKKKSLIERKADRLIFNVGASMASQGMDAAETLANVPMMKVDDNLGTISITGKSSVAVMINGKILNLSGTALMNYLKTIRSENIEKIEVITTPPAKYEAQGNSGLVNIVLKKNPNLGFNGSLNSTLVQKTYAGFSDNLNLNYQTEKLALSFKMSYNNLNKKSDENYSILGETQSFSKSERKDMYSELSPSFNASYSLSKNSEIGINYIFANQKPAMNIKNKTEYLKNGNQIEELITYTKHREKNEMHTLSIYYDLKLDSLGKKLSIAGNYYLDNSATNVDFNTLQTSNQNLQNVKTNSMINPKIFSGQADLELPYSFGTIETGVKFNQFKNASDLSYFNFSNNEWIADFSKANVFQYDEKNYAAYFSFAKKIGENWETKLGVRYEDTYVSNFSPNSNQGIKYHYGQWFPSAFVSYKNNKNTYNFSYSRRINRPGMDNLNPFRWYNNPYSYSSGNPLLQPSYINNFEFAYVYNNKLSASLYYLRLKNAFGQISIQDGLSQVGTYLNFYNNNFFGMNFSYTEKIIPWWETSISANATLHNSTVFNINAETQKGTSFSYTINNTMTLNKEKTLVFFLNFDHTLPYKNVNSYFYDVLDLSGGLKVSLMQKQLQINATVTNIFAQRFRGDSYYHDNFQHFNNYWDGRSLRLSVNYVFGNQDSKKKNRNVNFEEKQRAH